MRDGLIARLREDTSGQLKDIVLAGSGEPTAVTNLGVALETIQDVCEQMQSPLPLRIFTNGRHLNTPAVYEALGRWRQRGGELWVKLDGARNDTVAFTNGRRFDVAAHIQSIWTFASNHSIGIQTMLVCGPGIPEPRIIVDEVLDALKYGISIGARLTELHLLTLSRPPSNARAAQTLVPLSESELENHADRIRAQTALNVKVFPA